VEAWGFRYMQHEQQFFDRAEIAGRWFTEEYTPVVKMLREGDLLTTANGRDLRTPDDLFAVLDALGDDEALSLHVVRGVEELDVAVRFDANGGEHGAA